MDSTMSGAGLRDSGSSMQGSGSTTLPPLDMLERFPRRGSITDPSLHTSTPPPGQQQRTLNADGSPRHRLGPSPHGAVRPTSPYTFGSASTTNAGQDGTNNHLRRMLHSPEAGGGRLERASSGLAQQEQSSSLGEDRTPRDVEMHESRAQDIRPASAIRISDSPQFDYSMRRHSIAAVQSSDPARMPSPPDRIRREPHRSQFGPGSGSLKRKMSHDRLIYSTLGEESGDATDAMAVDPQEPAPKRRGSAFDTRIAQLSLYDRRDSAESRSPVSQVWGTDRRDSSSSMFSSISSVGTGYSGFSADSHTKGLQNFSWAAATAGGSGSDVHNEATDSSRTPEPRGSSTPGELPPPPPSTDPRPMPSLPSMHPYAADRRMSAPDATPRVMERALRSRSRPPSTRGVEATRSPTRSEVPELPAIRAPQSPSEGSETGAEPYSGVAESSGASGSGLHPPNAQMSVTPYSRSPELRVSHKLAERKRRKEMKELFDELRDQLPADRGMKASKWEILSKAVDYIQTLKQSEANMHREVEMLRHELEAARAGQYNPGLQGAGVGHPVVYSQGPPIAPYPPGQQAQVGRGAGMMHGYGAGMPQAQTAKGTPPM